MKKRVVSLIPFLIVCLVVLYAWFEFIFTENIATCRHYIGLAVVVINAVLYFLKYKQAILLTGVLLISATFNLLSFFTIIQTSSFGIGSVSTPEIQLQSLLLMIIYCVVIFNLFINWYLDMKEEMAAKGEK